MGGVKVGWGEMSVQSMGEMGKDFRTNFLQPFLENIDRRSGFDGNRELSPVFHNPYRKCCKTFLMYGRDKCCVLVIEAVFYFRFYAIILIGFLSNGYKAAEIEVRFPSRWLAFCPSPNPRHPLFIQGDSANTLLTTYGSKRGCMYHLAKLTGNPGIYIHFLRTLQF